MQENIWRIAICDEQQEDREITVQMMKKLLDAEKISYLLSEYDSGQMLLSDIQCGTGFQLLILDVMLGEMDGITLSATLRKAGNNVAIIFVSHNREMAMRGYEVSAARYLAKPLDMDKLREALLFCYRGHRSQAETLLPTETGERRTLLSEIQFVEAFGRGTKFYLENEIFESRKKISEVAKMLLPSNFLLCHRGFVVNLEQVKWIRHYEFVLKSGIHVPIGKGRYAEVHQRFVDFITS